MNPPAVWIVEDDLDDQLFVEKALKAISPEITTRRMRDGIELIESLLRAAALPQLILLDVNMPLMNGLEALAELRRMPAYQHVPVVMLTTADDLKTVNKSIELGASRFLTKPNGHQELIRLLRALMEDLGFKPDHI